MNETASPAPLVRPTIPGTRTQSGGKAPRLGLAIPPATHQRAVNSAAAPPMPDSLSVPALKMPSRPGPPKLSLATPSGTSSTPQADIASKRRLPPLQFPSANGTSSDDSEHSRANSLAQSSSSQMNGSMSTASSLSALDFAKILHNTADSGSAASSTASHGVGMEREGSMQNLIADLKKLELEKGRPLDVEDLDDTGWKAARKEGRIEELGSLGEGAGGAVTRCILKGGKTVFALKVLCILLHHSSC